MMDTEFEVYPSAPITEAVLDIRVTPDPDFRAEGFKEFIEKTAAEYPRASPLATFAAVGLEHGVPKFDNPLVGYKGTGRSNEWVYQATVSGLTVNRLAPYTHWADLKSMAQKMWDIYREVARPNSVLRCGLRYINRIDIPTSGSPVDIEDYLSILVNIPASLPQHLSHYMFQVHLVMADLGGLCVINSAAVPPSRPSVISLILDIDLFTNVVPQTEPELWTLFERLRVRKNEVFESCITEKARELFR